MPTQFPIRERSFGRTPRGGMTLVLVVLIVSGILMTSIGIFNAVFTELTLSSELGSSFNALNAADEGVERLLYYDRVLDFVGIYGLCSGNGPCEYDPAPFQSQGSCLELDLRRRAQPVGDTIVRGVGSYPAIAGCLGAVEAIKRSATVPYQKSAGP